MGVASPHAPHSSKCEKEQNIHVRQVKRAGEPKFYFYVSFFTYVGKRRLLSRYKYRANIRKNAGFTYRIHLHFARREKEGGFLCASSLPRSYFSFTRS